MPNRYNYDDIIESNKQVMDKLKDIDDKIKAQNLSQKKGWVVNLGFSCIIFGYSIIIATVINISNLSKSIGNLLTSSITIIIMGFILMVFSNKIIDYLSKRFKDE